MEILYLGLRIVFGHFYEFCHQSLLVIFAVHEKSIVHKYLQQQNMHTSIYIKTWIKVELSRATRLPCVGVLGFANFSDQAPAELPPPE